LNGSLTTQKLNKKVLQAVHTLQIQAVDGLESLQLQSGPISHQSTSISKWRGRERGGERDWGE